MKRRAKLYLITLSCASLALFVVLSLMLIQRQSVTSSHKTLENYLSSTLALAEPPEDVSAFVQNLSAGLSGDIRITILDLQGNVLADSQAAADFMPPHADREEIASALTSGSGESLRASDTTGVRTLYAARLWQNRYVLRFAMPVADARDFADRMLPVLIVLFLGMCVLITVAVDRFTGRLMRPFEQMLVYLEGTLQSPEKEQTVFQCEYEEMQPVVRYFHYLLDQISGHIRQITEKTTEVENIMDSMQEGLVLLDESLNILMINPQAIRFLSVPEAGWNTKITWLFRDPVFVEAMNQAAQRRSNELAEVTLEGKIYRFYINPVPDDGFVLLISDVTEVVQLERMRSDFVANVSHELKTPLTSISGFAELIENGMVSDPAITREYAGKIRRESHRLVRLIEDILRLSAIENASPEESLNTAQPVEVDGVFREVLELLAPQMEEKGLEVSVEGSLRVQIRHEHLHELVMNLCDNAVKYNRDRGSIQIHLLRDGFSVTDTGIGIPPEYQSRVFERFYRVDRARSRKTGGTGLGLSIVKHIAALYGGSVSVGSGPGGSTFTVVFPPHLVV